MKPLYGDRIKLLFTDTDSLCYEITTDDFYEDMKPYKNMFDCSELPKEHSFYSLDNKKVIGKFKDETNGVEIDEFVGLRSKMYSFTLNCAEGEKKQGKKKLKGVSKAVVKKDISHNDYVSCIKDKRLMSVEMISFKSTDHKIFTNIINKIGLSCFDDKRYILDDGISTYAYGNKNIKKNY